MSCNKTIANALGHDHYVDYQIETISDAVPLSQVVPEWASMRKSADGTKGIEELREICGAGTWADGTPIVVGVIDTGLDKTHLEAGAFGKDAKYKNFTTDRSALDQNGHGSHVSSVITGSTDSKFFTGLAPKAKLVHGKCLGGRQGSGASSWIRNAAQWCIDEGAHIVSASLGGGGYDQVSADLYRKFFDAGRHFQAAAGNAGKGGEKSDYPALYDTTRSIASMTYQFKTSSFSSESRKLTKTDVGTSVFGYWLNGKTATISGTSMATPLATGIDLLLLGYFDRMGFGKLNQADYDEKVKVGYVDLGIAGNDTYFGQGYLNPWLVIDHYGLPSDDKPVDPVKPVDPKPPVGGKTCGDLLFHIPATDICIVKV